MLVIISDLHLTDNTVGQSIPAGAFHLFAERLADLAESASWRADGQYRPVDHVDLVLLGDVLDLIRSARWLANESRPWHDPQSARVVATVGQIVVDILAVNAESFTVLRRLASQGITLQPSDRRGRPAHDRCEHPVPVRIHYLVGNHDWHLHLSGMAYDRIRKAIIEHLGLANRFDLPFPHDPGESDAVLETLRRHRVLARHGDIYDPFNFDGDRNSSSLGDAVVVELINRFTYQIEAEFASELPADTLAGLRELDNIRPTLLAPVWIDGLLERTCTVPSQRKQIKLTWDRLADRFLQLDFVRSRDTWSPVDLVDGLQRVLKFSKRLSTGWVSAIVTWLHSLQGPNDSSYHRHALAEQDFRNRRAKHIVYGHTHQPENMPLDASYAEGYVLNQMYFNAGTWRRVYRPTQWAPAEHEFISADAMTFLAFYHGDERRGRPFETWSGTLGLALPGMGTRTLRVDPSHARASGRFVPPPALPTIDASTLATQQHQWR